MAELHRLWKRADEAGAKVARDKLQQVPPAQRLEAIAGTAPEVIDRVAEYMEAGRMVSILPSVRL